MDFWRLLGHAKTDFVRHETPIIFESKDGLKESLLELTRGATPPCQLKPISFNGHLQTFWTAVKSQDLPIYYKRKIFEADDPAYAGTFAVDFVVQKYDETDEALPPRTTNYQPSEA